MGCLRLLLPLLVLALQAGPASPSADSSEVQYFHLIAHSHCDPGWLETFEGYFNRDVAAILSGVTEALYADPGKRFIWSEISFFMRWWESRDRATKNKFYTIVSRGQLEFVGGGWVQHDEANPSYDAVINQVTEGHEYVLKLFGQRPRIGWQIDPFGHSAITPSLFSLMGYVLLRSSSH